MIRHGILETSRIRASGPTYPTDGLVERWSFTNDNLVGDINGYTWAVNNVSYQPSYESGKLGSFHNILFPANNTGLKANSSQIKSTISDNAPFSWSFWVKNDSSSGAYIGPDYMCFTPTGGINKEINISHLGKPNNAGFRIGSNNADVSTGSTLANWQWNNIIGTFDGSTIKVYGNGYLGHTTTSTTYSGTPTNIYWGIHSNGASGLYPVKYTLIYLYSKALSQAEVTQLYNGGSGV